MKKPPSEVRKFASSHITRMWSNRSFWFRSPDFSPCTTCLSCTNHLELQMLPFTVITVARGSDGSDFRTATLCPVEALPPEPDPKSSAGVDGSICRAPAWKVKAVCLSSPCWRDRPAICPRRRYRGRLCLLEDLQMFPEAMRAFLLLASSCELPGKPASWPCS